MKEGETNMMPEQHSIEQLLDTARFEQTKENKDVEGKDTRDKITSTKVTYIRK